MDKQHLNKPEHLTAEQWRRHLHWIDQMNRQADENTAAQLARIKEDARLAKHSLPAKTGKPRDAESGPGPFWLAE
jgi:hypothetical protein